jgi:hypothetical protein
MREVFTVGRGQHIVVGGGKDGGGLGMDHDEKIYSA